MKGVLCILFFSIGLSINAFSEERDRLRIDLYKHYYQKCKELIEMNKSIAANWTTSKLEAMAAGECLAAINIIPEVAKSYYEKSYRYSYNGSYKKVRCNTELLKLNKLGLAQFIVDQKLKTVDDIRNTFCEL